MDTHHQINNPGLSLNPKNSKLQPLLQLPLKLPRSILLQILNILIRQRQNPTHLRHKFIRLKSLCLHTKLTKLRNSLLNCQSE